MDNNITPWIEHLNKPLVLAGFTLFVLAGLIKLFKPEKLNGAATERLMNRGMLLAFLLGLLIVLFAFADSFLKAQADRQKAAAGNRPTVTQTITHSQGSQTQTGGDAYVNEGTGTLSHPATPSAPANADVTQTIDGGSGVQTQSGRDAHIQTTGQ